MGGTTKYSFTAICKKFYPPKLAFYSTHSQIKTLQENREILEFYSSVTLATTPVAVFPPGFKRRED